VKAKVSSDKRGLRESLREALAAVPQRERARASTALVLRLQQQAVWRSTTSLLLFAPLRSEPDIWPLAGAALDACKQLALLRHECDGVHYSPRFVRDLERDLVAGLHGIREPRAECPPVALNQLDLLLVPGLAFDLRGHRLGRGKGVFDRLLAAASGVRVGVAFDCQIVEAVPVEPHDARVDFVLTPTRWHEVTGRRGA